jgi:hypothetical protein
MNNQRGYLPAQQVPSGQSKDSRIASAIGQQRKEIDTLEKYILMLSARLEPLLRQEPSGEGNLPDIPVVANSLPASIEQATGDLSKISTIVSDILDRIEI